MRCAALTMVFVACRLHEKQQFTFIDRQTRALFVMQPFQCTHVCTQSSQVKLSLYINNRFHYLHACGDYIFPDTCVSFWCRDDRTCTQRVNGDHDEHGNRSSRASNAWRALRLDGRHRLAGSFGSGWAVLPGARRGGSCANRRAVRCASKCGRVRGREAAVSTVCQLG